MWSRISNGAIRDECEVTASDSEAKREVWASLITVTYNSAEALRRFWDRPEGIPEGVEWIVVDNCSTDDSVAVARAAGARVVAQRRNVGFSAANNAGLDAARGSFIGFVNPDVRVSFDDLPALARLAEERSSLVSPQLLNADGSLQPNGRGFPYLWHKVLNRLGRESSLAGGYLLYSEGSTPRSVVWVMGAAVLGRRSDFERIGGWDPHFFLYYEDKDICLRAWRNGIPVVLVPSAAWTHGWARETTGFKLAPWRHELASMAKFYSRYPEFLLPPAAADRRFSPVRAEVYGARR